MKLPYSTIGLEVKLAKTQGPAMLNYLGPYKYWPVIGGAMCSCSEPSQFLQGHEASTGFMQAQHAALTAHRTDGSPQKKR